jgi:Spy/CpxP family protein refolding chaperone
MTKTVSSLLLPMVLSCAPALMAQTATAPQRPHDFVKTMTAKLGLTAEQQTQATTIFANARAGESTVRASLKTAHQGLGDAIKSNNTVSIEQISTTIGTLTAQLTMAQSKAHAAFYQILTPEQRTTLAQLESQHSGWFQRGMRASSRANGQ